MTATILLINYLPSAAQKGASIQDEHAAAETIAALDGLHWKYWLRSQDDDSFGGVYLFDTKEQAVAGGHLLQSGLANVGAQNIDLRYFGVNIELSALTRGFVKTKT